MHSPYLFGVFLLFLIGCSTKEESTTSDQYPVPAYTLVIHGGAGAIERSEITPEQDSAYRAVLQEALQVGEAILSKGGIALDAVVAAIKIMEDSPLFNAGKGAVFTHEGHNEMDASIMDGRQLEAGAVAGITRIKNPILAARAVMEQSEHVFLSGAGADAFGQSVGLDTVPPSYFYTERRWENLQKAKAKASEGSVSQISPGNVDFKFGTVGAVALDNAGNLAAGTSTGGMTNKRWNRIGDAPVIGAGTYADNRSCAVSCTGHGEYFIRYAVAHELAARVRHGGQPLDEAAQFLIHEELFPIGGLGGLIALDAKGNVTFPFSTSGMYRGCVRPDTSWVAIYADE